MYWLGRLPHGHAFQDYFERHWQVIAILFRTVARVHTLFGG